jgi:osmotically-inducible protein OsmY
MSTSVPATVTRLIDALPGVDRSRLEVVEADGTAILRGSVRTLVERRALQRVLGDAANAPPLRLEVDVQPEESDRVSDAELLHRIQASLHWHALLHDLHLCVSSCSGRIGLAGTVPSTAHASAAQTMVESMRGVVDVDNSLRVGQDATRTDLAARVRQALERCEGVDAARVRVDCRNGSVILEGEIGDWTERRAILDAARATPGVGTIEDRLLTDD